ncbi:MAG: tripartite tricarboxylate transporter substrate binding protein [Rhizobiales bacterium]|nr:tripartite tricarboxylate transporter substrate binding protein [Hyphomicrobiales bacterium]
MTIRQAFFVALMSCATAAGAAQAQTYPTKTVTLIVPASPGGVIDTMARMLAQNLSTAWKSQVIVENKPGATNQIAAEYVARAAPDGYTLFLSPEATFVVNPYLFSKLPYDPEKDFTPITGLISIRQALVAHPSVPANTIKELIELAKKKPGELNYGTFGVGSSGHLNMEMFAKTTGTKLTAVHYKGAAPAFTDVVAGHIQLVFVATGSAAQSAAAGKVKFIAIGSPKRFPRLPNVEAINETVPGFEAVSWFALFGPAGMPRPVVDNIRNEVVRILNDPQVRETFLERRFFDPTPTTPEELAAYIKSEAKKWSQLVRDAGIKIK